VCHTIDETSIYVTQERTTEEVLAIEPPKIAQQLCALLGLASYFRDYTQRLAVLAHLLHEVLTEYEVVKSTLVRSPETTDKFNEMNKAIKECPNLLFAEERAPVF
jgi:hypothetical protein